MLLSLYALKSRTEKGLHIPFLFLLIFYTPSALFKRSSHLIIFFQDISFSTVPTPGAIFRLLGNTKWRLPFVPASRLRTVTVLQLSASHPHWATCTLWTPTVWVHPAYSGSVCKSLIGSRFVGMPAFVLPVPAPEREWPFRRWVFMRIPSSGDGLVLPKMLGGSWLTASPQH